MLIDGGGRKFEKPDAGMFLGTIIDVIDLGLVPSKNPKFPDPKVRIRIVWVLDKNDSEGKPYVIMEQPTAKASDGGGGTKKSRLYEIYEGVFGTAPPIPFESENFIGRSNLLFLAREGEYVNIKGFMPVPAGQVLPVAPAGFVRDKDDPKKQAVRVAKAQTLAGQPVQRGAGVVGSTAQTSLTPTVSDEDIPF
jgi:hypothetical protein